MGAPYIGHRKARIGNEKTDQTDGSRKDGTLHKTEHMNLEALKRMLTGAAAPGQGQGLLGQGMAQQGAQALQNRPYQLHVQEAQAMGEQPMMLEQFMKMLMQQQMSQQSSNQIGNSGWQ